METGTNYKNFYNIKFIHSTTNVEWFLLDFLDTYHCVVIDLNMLITLCSYRFEYVNNIAMLMKMLIHTLWLECESSVMKIAGVKFFS